jgi:hypothetical protein
MRVAPPLLNHFAKLVKHFGAIGKFTTLGLGTALQFHLQMLAVPLVPFEKPEFLKRYA